MPKEGLAPPGGGNVCGKARSSYILKEATTSGISWWTPKTGIISLRKVE